MASCLKGSTRNLTRNRAASVNISPVRSLWVIVTVLAESTTQIGDDTGHSRWLYSTLWRSLSKHARSAVPAPKHKRGPCFVVVAQSPAFWSTPVMLPWRQDSSFSPRHCRVRQGEAGLSQRPKIHNKDTTSLTSSETSSTGRRQRWRVSDCISAVSRYRKTQTSVW